MSWRSKTFVTVAFHIKKFLRNIFDRNLFERKYKIDIVLAFYSIFFYNCFINLFFKSSKTSSNVQDFFQRSLQEFIRDIYRSFIIVHLRISFGNSPWILFWIQKISLTVSWENSWIKSLIECLRNSAKNLKKSDEFIEDLGFSL